MIDLSSDIDALAERLGPAQGSVAMVVQFVAATSGEGTSTIAREFALHAAHTARRGVWLVELDLMRGGQYAALQAGDERYGALGAAVRASPDDSAFFAITPAGADAEGKPWPDARYLAGYPVGGRRFWVTRFRREALRPGQSVRILPTPGYWSALRAHADLVVVDAPSADRSEAVLAVAPHVDETVLVVAENAQDTSAAVALRDALDAAGARCPGFVFNRARSQPPGFLRRMLP